jgi:hypothetical protein
MRLEKGLGRWDGGQPPSVLPKGRDLYYCAMCSSRPFSNSFKEGLCLI